MDVIFIFTMPQKYHCSFVTSAGLSGSSCTVLIFTWKCPTHFSFIKSCAKLPVEFTRARYDFITEFGIRASHKYLLKFRMLMPSVDDTIQQKYVTFTRTGSTTIKCFLYSSRN